MFIPISLNSYESVVDHSRFIAYVIPIKSLEDININLDKIREEHIKAKHILYAYKLNEITKSNDDNEPGSISKSFLELISNNNLNNILIIVVRYFGGILLGASRLLRTYINTVNEAIKGTKLGEMVDVYRYHLEVDYPTFNKIKNARYRVENVNYFDTIKLDVISRNDILDDLKSFKVIKIDVTRDKEII